ncbi:MAG TPA: LysE family transporter, partial [Armatimonadota bacterium]|nr:LysE family transporter [Armatimonadota bacterium]
MDVVFLLKGLAIGFSIAAPVGPISLLCIRRSLAHGRAAGLASGMGAAAADGIYGAVAAFGLTSVSGFLVAQQQLFGMVGGVLLVGLGAQISLSLPPAEGAGSNRVTLARAYASTFVLTLSNPVTILMFAAIFAGLGIAAAADVGSAALLTAGVFLGSAVWWVILSAGVGASKSRFSPRTLVWVNRISGAVIAGFGIA